MRRPTLCSEVHTVDDAYLNSSLPADKEGRLSRVKRMLADSLLLGRRPGPSGAHAPTYFGTPLDEAVLNKEGVPIVVVKICTYLENHGLQYDGLFQLSAGNPRLAERLRGSMDLESSGDVFSVALLLKLWLKELPEPLVWDYVALELLATHEKVREDSISLWRQAIRAVLCTLPETNLRLLRYILRFLHRYSQHQQQRSTTSGSPTMLSHLGVVFAPLLILKGTEYSGAGQLALANQLTSRLIQDHAAIFHQWLVDHPSGDGAPVSTSSAVCNKHNHASSARKAMVPTDNTVPGNRHRKRKERNESINSNQSLERKVVRSNSEERHVEVPVAESKSDNIRRVSSHEDFRQAKQCPKVSSTGNRYTTVVELSSQPHSVHFFGLPLQECNHLSKDQLQLQQTPRSPQEPNHFEKENEQHCQLSQTHTQQQKERDRQLIDAIDDEHEKRRSSERFSRSLIPPRSATRRNLTRKRRGAPHHSSPSASGVESDGNTSSKENDDAELDRTPHHAHLPAMVRHALEMLDVHSISSDEKDVGNNIEAEVDSLSDESRPESSHSFLQLHPPERERSPSPSVSPCTPPLDLSTLHQSVDSSEPVASRACWSFARQQHQEDEGGRGVLLSPRNSMILTRRTFIDHNVPPSPPGDHHGACLPGSTLDIDNIANKLNKQISSIKKKLKRYEEGFEREFGYRPSQADKMANKDTKRMCAELSRLRKELKQIKEDPLSAVVVQPSGSGGEQQPLGSSSVVNTGSIEETVTEVERRLREKRRAAGRPDNVDDMTAEQQAAEKVAMQKSLLLLEKLCGRATNKPDREIVRPLYDRYRMLKRMVARAASSKLKDSINELATIHEHETMDFTPSTSLLAMADASNTEGPVSPMPAVSSANGTGCSVGNSGEFGETVSTTSLLAQLSAEEASDSQTSSSDSLGENLHSLPLSDLVLQLTQTREEKKRLRRVLRELEEQFQQRTGRRMQREERSALSLSGGEQAGAYSAYKQIKAKLRLLEALVAKQR